MNAPPDPRSPASPQSPAPPSPGPPPAEASAPTQAPSAAAGSDEPASEPASTVLSTGIIAAGITLFVVGLAAIIISFAAPVFHAHISDYFYLAAMLCPLGMIVGVLGALVSGRRRR